MTLDELKTYIRDIRDFPKPGIVFKDITPLLASGPALVDVVDRIADHYRDRIDIVLGIESRGFVIGAAARKPAGIQNICSRVPLERLPKFRGTRRGFLIYPGKRVSEWGNEPSDQAR